MLKAFKKLWNDERGNALIIAGAALPLLVGSAGLATDTIQWTLWKRQLQRAADSAAIAGVYDRVSHSGETANTETAVHHDLDLNNHTLAGNGSTNLLFKQVTYPANSGVNTNQVMVTLKVQRKLPFSSLFMSTAPEIIANATAASVPGPGDPCVLGLDESGKTIVVEITGNADIHMPDCITHANGSSNNAAVAKGSSKMKAKAVSAVGGIQQSDNWDVESYRPYSPKIDDPYAEVEPYSAPSDMKCAVTSSTDKKGNVTYTPVALDETTVVANAKDQNGNPANCFSSLSVGSGQSLDLGNGGTFYINGGNTFIQGDLTCTKCTIVLTNKDTSATATIGDFKVNADAKINMTAPDTGNFKGIAIYQDRRAEDKTTNKINGNSESKILGSLYFPNQELDYNGTGTTEALCTRFVAKRIKFSGNSTVSNKFKSAKECAAFGLEELNAGLRIRLVA